MENTLKNVSYALICLAKYESYHAWKIWEIALDKAFSYVSDVSTGAQDMCTGHEASSHILYSFLG
jgi:hypothetical protein